MTSRVRLAVTLGDPRGIGPEIAHAAIRGVSDEDPALEFVVVGPSDRLPDRGSERALEIESVGRWDGPKDAAAVAARAIEAAVERALSGDVSAVVTAPIHKPSLQAAGWDHPGHTEMLQSLTGASNVGMLMCAETTRLGGPLRVLLATTHHALRSVADLVTTDRLVAQTVLLEQSLRSDWRFAEPWIGLCALNPHASDGGLFGDEEARVFEPAVQTLTGRGVRVSGPHPADTVFSRALRGEWDAVVAPYHDVGMAAFKTVSFGTGVNVTLGLPFVRTSPDHGTAFELAGTGRADASSMAEAIRLAARLARSRFDSPPEPA